MCTTRIARCAVGNFIGPIVLSFLLHRRASQVGVVSPRFPYGGLGLRTALAPSDPGADQSLKLNQVRRGEFGAVSVGHDVGWGSKAARTRPVQLCPVHLSS